MSYVYSVCPLHIFISNFHDRSNICKHVQLWDRPANTARPFKGLGSFTITKSHGFWYCFFGAWNSSFLLISRTISAQYVSIFSTSASLFSWIFSFGAQLGSRCLWRSIVGAKNLKKVTFFRSSFAFQDRAVLLQQLFWFRDSSGAPWWHLDPRRFWQLY